ncbi:5'-nucleotidase [Paramixta manurensis]|uniref:5'-nucleotidase n=1 Tax=Paramixta manurensis TaxID=2740817 RepID=A0A6M8UCI1_9GAMM|nr:5'-nucleotidase [Erwiniaceae bacterium PD-1]
MRNRYQILLGGLAGILLAVPLAAQAWEKDRTYQFTVLHSNDLHGQFWANAQGEYGLAAQKTVVDQIRYDVQAHGGALLVLSGGDVNSEAPETDRQNAEPAFRGMNLIGYQGMAIGDSEFTHPLSVLRQQQKWAKFPLLSANIYQTSSGKRLFQPYALFNRMGLKIAVIGLTRDQTATTANPQNLQDIAFHSPIEEAKTVVNALRAHEKPDVIIAATHLGYYADGTQGDVALARALPPGYLNIIVGGHSGEAVCMVQNGVGQSRFVPGMHCVPDRQNQTWIMQAQEGGKSIGRADFTFRNGVLTLAHYQLIPINPKQTIANTDGSNSQINNSEPIPADPAMLKLLLPFQRKADAMRKVSNRP